MLRAGRRREERILGSTVYGHKWPFFHHKIGQKCGVCRTCTKCKEKSAAPLREMGWLGTLNEDVRDVAAAVLCSEGPGRSGKMLNRLRIQVI
jgi:hypothetical protein